MASISDLKVQPDFSLKDALNFEHAKLDARCVEIWPKMWHTLLNDPSAAATEVHDPSAAATEIHEVIRKIVRNFTHVHQLHRLVNKFLDALRLADSANWPVGVLFPAVLRSELGRCFLDTSEQQMSLILGILVKELGDHLKSTEPVVTNSRIKAISQLLWILLKHLRVKTTTRQEVLQALCKQYLDMKDSIILPFLSLTQDLESRYCLAVLVHAWASFPLVFRDKFAVSMEEPLAVIDNTLAALASPSEEQSDLAYWKHRLVLLRFNLSGELTDAESFFNWTALHSLPGTAAWAHSPFEITPETLPIALWDSICSNYTVLPGAVTAGHHADFARFLVRTLVASLRKQSALLDDTVALTLKGVSETFLDTVTVSGAPDLHAALVQTLELSLKDCLEKTKSVVMKPNKKRSKQPKLSAEKCTELLSVLRILAKIGFYVDAVGVAKFSLSLVWKSFDYLLEHHTAWSSAGEQSLMSAESNFADLILSVPSKDHGYWTNVLWDFCAVRERMIKMDSTDEMLRLLNQQCFRIILHVAESGVVDSLTQLWTKSKETAPFLTPVLLDVLLGRLHQPGVVKLVHAVIAHLCEGYIVLLAATEKDQAALFHCAAVSRCIQAASRTLKKIGSKTFAAAIASLKKLLTWESVYALLDEAIQSQEPMRLDMALSNLALFVEVRSACKVKVVRRVLSLFCPSPVMEDELAQAKESSVVPDLDGLDDVGLLRVLVSLSEKSPRAVPTVQVTNRPSPKFITSSLVTLFSQFAKYCKPADLTNAVEITLKTVTADTVAGASPIEWTLLLCKLVVSLKEVPAMAKAMIPVDDLILHCLGTMLSTKDVNVLCDVMTLLQILLRGQRPLEVCRIALSRPLYDHLTRADLSDSDFTSLFEKSSVLLNDIMMQPHLVTPQTSPVIINATSIWLISILQRSRQQGSADETESPTARKALMIRNSSFVERFLGSFAKHQREFSKLVIHLIAVYCHGLQNGALYPEAKEHIVAGLYRLLDGIDPHSRSMGSVTMGVESREIYKALVEDHLRFHKYRGLV
ncbi:hypothetical protein BV898_08131 [Hypsibius exemplaris]|uniref:Nucleolar 27S pre-rRNA processing Urb2/Npa2 C-terminal domain-containing protein n=1 Tax=Hypsibius exemplaris TaxID=2072580 RepID=A0A1W0WRM6_HYPEX|nr:hypothetical protein BV898_08131 [Hypsibius exemplaris]